MADNQSDDEAHAKLLEVIPLVEFTNQGDVDAIRQEYADLDVDALLSISGNMGAPARRTSARDQRLRIIKLELDLALRAVSRTLPQCSDMRAAIAERLWGAEKVTLAVGVIGSVSGLLAAGSAILNQRAATIIAGLVAFLGAVLSLVAEFKRRAVRDDVTLVTLFGLLTKARGVLIESGDMLEAWDKSGDLVLSQEKRVLNQARRVLEIATEVDDAIAEVPPPLAQRIELERLRRS